MSLARSAPITIHQDANLYIARLNPGAEATLSGGAGGRYAWLQIARGSVRLPSFGNSHSSDVELQAGGRRGDFKRESEIRVVATTTPRKFSCSISPKTASLAVEKPENR